MTLGLYYIIRDKRNHKHLPRARGHKGHTYMELTRSEPPRLFTKKHHAKTALNWWLKGTVEADYDYYEGDIDGYTINPKLDRRSENMEIVPVKLTEAK